MVTKKKPAAKSKAKPAAKAAHKPVAKAKAKRGDPPKSLRLEPLAEGLCVETMHVGAYDEEGPVLARLHREFLPQNGLAETGHHHEIYVGDPCKTAPERLKTVLRQPVRRIAG